MVRRRKRQGSAGVGSRQPPRVRIQRHGSARKDRLELRPCFLPPVFPAHNRGGRRRGDAVASGHAETVGGSGLEPGKELRPLFSPFLPPWLPSPPHGCHPGKTWRPTPARGVDHSIDSGRPIVAT
jgi:hypothetical protein